MKNLKSCAFNMDTNCVELVYTDRRMIAIDVDGVENEYAEDMYQRLELDWLIYNAPLEYADLVLNGDVEGYLKRVTHTARWKNRNNKYGSRFRWRSGSPYFCIAII